MKQRNLLLLFLLCLQCTARGQSFNDRIYVNVSGLYLLPFTDVYESNFEQNRLDMGLEIGLGYRFSEVLSLRGGYMVGNMDGDIGKKYSETQLNELNLNADIDLFQLFNSNARWRGVAEIGVGWLWYNSRRYFIAEDPYFLQSYVPNDGRHSQNATIRAGGTIYAPLNERIELMVGAGIRLPLGADYLDAMAAEDDDDMYGAIQLGLSFTLGRTVRPDESVVKTNDYDVLKEDKSALEQEIARVTAEKDKELADQKARLAMAQRQLDSARTALSKREIEIEELKASKVITATDSGKRWRVVVGSFPSQAMAQRFIDRVNLEKDEMIILFVEDLDTYRVVYKSFDSMSAALKARQKARTVISDAWVIEF
ncbi:hypothetical protein GC167_01755 [bacterium]|nr:hypothetical protein [bacterium]